MNIFSFIHWWE